MSSLTVVVDLATLDTKASPATGEVHVRFGDVDFPGTDWSDFAVVVLGWWLEQITDLLEQRARVQMKFMDGPFAVALEPSPQDDRWRATALYDGAPYRDLPQGIEISPSGLTASLRDAAHAVLAESNRRGVESRDVRRLATSLEALTQASGPI